MLWKNVYLVFEGVKQTLNKGIHVSSSPLFYGCLQNYLIKSTYFSIKRGFTPIHSYIHPSIQQSIHLPTYPPKPAMESTKNIQPNFFGIPVQNPVTNLLAVNFLILKKNLIFFFFHGSIFFNFPLIFPYQASLCVILETGLEQSCLINVPNRN